MRAYIVRRLLLIVPTFLIVTIAVFVFIRLIPGDVVEYIARGAMKFGSAGVDPTESIRHELGLDVPVWSRYGTLQPVAQRPVQLQPPETHQRGDLPQADRRNQQWTCGACQPHRVALRRAQVVRMRYPAHQDVRVEERFQRWPGWPDSASHADGGSTGDSMSPSSRTLPRSSS